jgi:hypothetical protein
MTQFCFMNRITQIIIFLAFLHPSLSVFSQQVELLGSVKDKKTSEVLSGVRVTLLSLADSSIVSGAVSDDEGAYSLSVIPGKYILKVTFFSYKDEVKTIQLEQGKNELNILLSSDAKIIDEIQVEGVAIRVEQKGDTTQYNADAFKTNPDATVEDLVTKMPGITIENGVVKAQGEEIKRVYIDGEEFFGEDATAALKNLPAEIVSKIQIYDHESDQARFTGMSDGNEAKALNIVTKPGKNQGQFGKIYAGYGYPDLYLGGLNVNIFKGTSKISIIGMSNNVNQQNFSSEDILGVSGSSSSSAQGGRGRGAGGGSGGSENFMVGQQNGISTTHSIGVNYSDKWGIKTKVTGSYFFNASKNENTQKTGREYFVSTKAGQLYDEDYSAVTRNFNHRMNFRFDIQLDSLNSLMVTPRLSYQGNNRNQETFGFTQDSQQSLINQIANSTFSNNNGINAGTSVLWRHKFTKPRRTLSVNLSGTYNNRWGDRGQESISQYYDMVAGDSLREINQFADNLTDGYSTSARVSYTEPLGKYWSGEVAYTPSYNVSNSDRRTYNYNPVNGLYTDVDTLLSNVFENQTIGNEAGTNFNFKKEKTNLQIGVNYQNNLLLNNQEFPANRNVKLIFHNVLPNLRFKYDFSKTKSIQINYRSSTRTPSIDQLQNVIDNSNPLSLYSGNENLKQQYNHRVFTRFNVTNVDKGSNFFVFLSGEMASNYITNSSIIATNDTIINGNIQLARGSQYRTPVNLDGNWNTRGYISYGIPITPLKINLNFNVGGGYGVNPGLINNIINKSQTTNTNAGIVIASNISSNIDFTIGYTFNYNNAVNNQQNRANNEYFVQNVSARFNWIIKERIVFNTNYLLNSYAGLGDEFNQTIMVWNAGVGYKLLKQKQLEIRLSVFDILNSNNSIVRNVTANYIEDVESRVLNRYFMLTATYNLRNFGTPNKGK